MEKLQEKVEYLRTFILKRSISNPAVSKASVGWQVEHILLTIHSIIDRLGETKPADFKSSFSASKLFVFTFKKIPRGRGKAPSRVTPSLTSTTDLDLLIAKTLLKVSELEKLDPNQYFEHPYFGHLKVKDAVKFLLIHTNHHLLIIKDILLK